MRPITVDRTKNEILLRGLPFPPSSNNCYVTAPPRAGQKFGLRFASDELKTFQRACGDYKKHHWLGVADSLDLIQGWRREGSLLGWCLFLNCHWSRCFTKDNRVKKFDGNNRTKAIEDEVFGTFYGINDSEVFRGSWIKKVTEADSESVAMMIYRVERNEIDPTRRSPSQSTTQV